MLYILVNFFKGAGFIMFKVDQIFISFGLENKKLRNVEIRLSFYGSTKKAGSYICTTKMTKIQNNKDTGILFFASDSRSSRRAVFITGQSVQQG